MKKQTLTLIILLAVLVLLAGGFFAVKALTKEPAEEPEAAEEHTVLFSADAAEITGFSYTIGGEKLSFENTENGWAYAEDPAMPLDPAKIDAMLSALTEIRAYKRIDTDEDFGFADNSIEIGVKTTDGAYYCTIGSENSIIDKAYLLTDESVVYTTDSAMRTSFTNTLDKLLLADTVRTIDAGSITHISVENGDNSYSISVPEERELYYSFRYVMENSLGKTPLDNAAMESYLANIVTPYLTCEDYAPTAEERSAAGFDDPAVVTVTYAEADEDGNEDTKTYQIFFGGTYADDLSNMDRRYVMLEDSNMLFYMADATAQNLLSPVLSDLSPSYLAQMNFSEVTEFSFALNGEKHTALIQKKDDETVCTLDGKELSPAFVESFFLDLTLVTSEGGYTDPLPTQAPAISAEIMLNTENGTQSYTLSIYEHNANFCIAEFSGRQDAMLISIRDYNRIFDSLEELKANAAR